MADGLHTNDDDAAPASLAVARAGLTSHAFGQSTGLVRYEERAIPYAEQLAETSLGYVDKSGQRVLWGVKKVPLYGPDGRVWPGAWGTMRDDTEAPLGVVGDGYKPQQTVDLAKALDLTFHHLPASLRPRVVNAGTLASGRGLALGKEFQGARVFAQMSLSPELSELLRVPADRDSETRAFLTSTNTHDGTSSTVLGGSSVRIWCGNTFSLAQTQSKVGGLVMKHTAGNSAAYTAHVTRWFRDLVTGYKLEGERLRAYSERQLSSAAIDKAVAEILFGEVLPAQEMSWQQKAKASSVIEMIEGRDGAFVARGDVTAYSVLQATTAYEMHRRPVRGTEDKQAEVRLWRVLTKDAKSITPRAFVVLDDLIKN